MKISLNEIKKLVPAAAKVSTDELTTLIGSRLVEIEEKIDLATKYANIYIVKVAECEPIPDTHLHLCQIDAGTIGKKFSDVSTSTSKPTNSASSNPTAQVVCGAPNVHKGMLAVWLAPGAIVPQTYGGEDFKLGSRKLRGHESNGMLAGLDEIDLGDDHSGIVEIDPAQVNATTGKKVQPGDSFAEAFDLNDIILDIENKSLTHRPDTFGLIGFAREVAGILGAKFDESMSEQSGISISGAPVARPVVTGELPILAPRRSRRSPETDIAGSSLISIKITNPELCQRYSCAVIEMSDATSDDKYLTPMDVFLAKAGMHGISKIVDVTNYLMLMTGQPLHAFDYDKFVAVGGSKHPNIIVRAAKEGEELQLLDGKTIECQKHDILITSNDVPVALAGAMGGKNTEIDASTKQVIIESATFSLYNLRKTQMAHGIFSEAITRFTKGQPAVLTMPVLEQACSMLGGKVLSVTDEYPAHDGPSVVKITTDDINSLLGTKYTKKQIISTLENVGFKISEKSNTLIVATPLWRTDIHIKEDIIEEVGRLLGYDNIPLDLPTRPYLGAEKNALLDLKTRARNILSGRISAHEVLTYSFVSRKLQESVGEDPADSYLIVNSISPELQCFRQSLAPSLLEKMRDNLKAGFKDFSLYEINQISRKSLGLDQDDVPRLRTRLAFATTGDFYLAKAAISALLADLGFKSLDFSVFDQPDAAPYLEPLHSAIVSVAAPDNTSDTTSDTTPVAYLGEVKSSILRQLKISTPVSVFELDLDSLLQLQPATTSTSIKLSKFPSVERDITLKVSAKQDFASVVQPVERVLKELGLNFTLTPTSIYQPIPAGTTKNISFHLRFSSDKKTLENTEISAIMESVEKSVKQAVGAVVI